MSELKEEGINNAGVLMFASADLFHRIGKVERMGFGIERMRSLLKESGLQEPVFTSNSFFILCFTAILNML